MGREEGGTQAVCHALLISNLGTSTEELLEEEATGGMAASMSAIVEASLAVLSQISHRRRIHHVNHGIEKFGGARNWKMSALNYSIFALEEVR